MTDLRKLFRIALSVVVVFTIITASATAAKPTNPLDAVWNAISDLRIDLQNQIDNIELIPGPKGDTGEQGIQGLAGADGTDGLQGAKGDTGEQGLKGDTGEQGTPGISSWERVSATSPSTYGEYQTITVSCTGIKKLLSGGTFSSYPIEDQRHSAITASYPSSDNTWTATATLKGDGSNSIQWYVTAWAICATVS